MKKHFTTSSSSSSSCFGFITQSNDIPCVQMDLLFLCTKRERERERERRPLPPIPIQQCCFFFVFFFHSPNSQHSSMQLWPCPLPSLLACFFISSSSCLLEVAARCVELVHHSIKLNLSPLVIDLAPCLFECVVRSKPFSKEVCN